MKYLLLNHQRISYLIHIPINLKTACKELPAPVKLSKEGQSGLLAKEEQNLISALLPKSFQLLVKK